MGLLSPGGDIMYLICHVTSHDHLIDRACKFMGGSTLCHHPSKFGYHGHYGSGDIDLVCHRILQDHLIKGSCDFKGRNRQGKLPSAKFGGYSYLAVKL